ncbi:MAG: MATE family efflux transporter [Flavobacteriia bacterium]|nr:MATE family efflux transporter [Flavobacteriia bacterium]
MLDYRYSTILKVALPLMVSSFIQAIVFLTDAAFLGRYDALSYDASGNAGLIYVTVFIALSGMADGSQILIARRIGQKRFDSIGRIFGTSIITHLLIALCLFSFIQYVMPSLLYYYSKHKDLANAQISFLSYRSYALFFAMITLSIQAFLFASGKTSVVLISALITALSNVFLDYVLIFGKGSFPELGLEGAAIANTIADSCGMLFLVGYIFFSKLKKEYNLFDHFSFNYTSFKELIKVGSPIMFQGVIALATWTIFFTWIEQIGKFELTVSQNIRAIYFLAFVPIWGFSATTKTYISQYIGSGDLGALKTIQKRIQILTVLFLFAIFHGAIFYPEVLISIVNPKATYQVVSGEILRYVSLSIYIYGFFTVYFQTINGSGNTRVTFFIEVICVIIYIIVAYTLIKILSVDIFWIWSVEYVYFISMGVLSLLYLRLFDWKRKVL